MASWLRCCLVMCETLFFLPVGSLASQGKDNCRDFSFLFCRVECSTLKLVEPPLPFNVSNTSLLRIIFYYLTDQLLVEMLPLAFLTCSLNAPSLFLFQGIGTCCSLGLRSLLSHSQKLNPLHPLVSVGSNTHCLRDTVYDCLCQFRAVIENLTQTGLNKKGNLLAHIPGSPEAVRVSGLVDPAV